MKAHAWNFVAFLLLLTLVVLPGHGKARAPGARPQGEKPKAGAHPSCDCLDTDAVVIDTEDLGMDRCRAMEDAKRAVVDADLQAAIAGVRIDDADLDLESLADLEADRAVRAVVQEGPEVVQEPGESGNVFFYSSDESGWLGVTIAEVTADNVKEPKLPAERGVLVTEVSEDSPAAKAGLKSGDVITELGGQRIEGTVQFRRLVRETPPGRAMTLTVWRDGRTQRISATLAPRSTHRRSGNHFYWNDGEMHIPMPPMPAMPAFGEVFAPRTPRLGIDAEDLSGDLGKYFGAPDGEGVLVREVRPGSPAEKAGLKAGDVIIKVAGERVRTSSDLRAALRAKHDGKTVDVVIIRKGSEMTLPAEVEPVTPPGGRKVTRRVIA